MIQNQSYSDSESDEDESNSFFSVCAENKINAMIARLRESEENYDSPEEFENEAVSMAIQQHGLRHCNKTERDFCKCRSEVNENHCNQNVLDGMRCQPTTSKPLTEPMSMIENFYCDKCSITKHPNPGVNSEMQNVQNVAYKQNIKSDDYEFDHLDFLNEAVGVAITKKGLSSSCNGLK